MLKKPAFPPNSTSTYFYLIRLPQLMNTITGAFSFSGESYILRPVSEPNLLSGLATPVNELLWEVIANPPHTSYTVQSILLLYMSTFSLSTDTTPILVSISQTIAISSGCTNQRQFKTFPLQRESFTRLRFQKLRKHGRYAIFKLRGESHCGRRARSSANVDAAFPVYTATRQYPRIPRK